MTPRGPILQGQVDGKDEFFFYNGPKGRPARHPRDARIDLIFCDFRMAADTDIPILRFASSIAWEQWLSQNYRDQREEYGFQFAKKASGIASVTYDEALDVALCFGWIDGQKKTRDADYFLQRFTPRRAKSMWSKRNVAKVATVDRRGANAAFRSRRSRGGATGTVAGRRLTTRRRTWSCRKIF